jgi:hypothetical protein
MCSEAWMRLRTLSLLVAVSVSLAACGGGGGGSGGPAATYSIGGTVAGLVGSGLVLGDSSGGSASVAGNGAFTLPIKVVAGASYSVSVTTQPSSPSQTCSVSGGSGTVSGANVSGIVVTCTINSYAIGGSVSGLAGVNLTLQENGGDNLVISANGSFAFVTPIASGASYLVTIAQQPVNVALNPGQTCTIANASGTVGGAAVTTVAVTCAIPSPLTSRLLDFASGTLGAVVADPVRHRVYVAAPARNELIVLDADSYLVLDHFFVGSAPTTLSLSSDGAHLYVGLNQGGAIAVVDLATFAVTTIPVATELGTPIITSLLEVRQGVVLVGGMDVGATPVKLLTVDVNNGRNIQPVAGGTTFSSVTSIVASADGHVVYLSGNSYAPTTVGGPEMLTSLDATKTTLPILHSKQVTSVANVVVSQDGTRLMDNGGALYDSSTLQRIATGYPGGVVAETRDHREVMQSSVNNVLLEYGGPSLGTAKSYQHDCAVGPVAMSATELRGEWMLNGFPWQLCVVSTTTPSQAPGVSGSRALPQFIPTPVFVPYAEVYDGYVNDAVIDSARGVAYASNGFAGSIDVYSLASQSIVASIALSDKPMLITMSDDGKILYAGLFNLGAVVAIDLSTRTVVTTINLLSALGGPGVFQLSEIAPGHLLVSALGGPVAGPSPYLVDVVISDPTSPKRVGCAAGYSGHFAISKDKHYLYGFDLSTGCAPEKRDLTLPGYPVVVSGPVGGYETGGVMAVSADGAHLYANGLVIDTANLQQTALLEGGFPIASSRPDIYYLVSGQTVTTIELHDLKILSVAQNVCQSVIDGVNEASMSADEKTVISVGDGADLCVTRIAP